MRQCHRSLLPTNREGGTISEGLVHKLSVTYVMCFTFDSISRDCSDLILTASQTIDWEPVPILVLVKAAAAVERGFKTGTSAP